MLTNSAVALMNLRESVDSGPKYHFLDLSP